MSGHSGEVDRQLQSKRVTVLGLGREGARVSSFLVQRGALVTATDLKEADQLQPVLEELAGLPIRYVLGGHPEEVLNCDVLFVSPGVPLDAAILLEARRRRLFLSSEARLFCYLCPAPIIGITGSSGKTTTCTLVAEMLAAAGRRVHLGGNIGSPLIGRLSDIQAEDVVVMELSSFQLDFFGAVLDAEPRGDLVAPLFPSGGWSPPIACVLNITPNHLDRHPSMEAYIKAKRNILAYQTQVDHAVLNWDDQVVRNLAGQGAGEVSLFSLHEPVPRGAYLRGETLVLRGAARMTDICPIADVRLRGMHNIANALAACALADALGVEPETMADVIRTFGGVEHRLEPVCEVNGAWYYNDSIATSPERAMAALRSFEEPIVLLAGGRDKHLPWDEWAELVSCKVVRVIAFGEAAALIEGVVERLGPKAPPLHHAESVADAVHFAHDLVAPGQVVLFSPGGTSFDAFRDYEERGQAFKRMVRALAC
jgi:UDP-N-acetylmuramoylalanine--D-glutamate ligase